jgi:hypothetical protein
MIAMRKARRNLVDVARHQETDGEDLVVFFVRQHREVRLIVGRGTRLQHGDLGVQLRSGIGQPAICAVVEGLIAQASRIGHHRKPHVPALGNPLGMAAPGCNGAEQRRAAEHERAAQNHPAPLRAPCGLAFRHSRSEKVMIATDLQCGVPPRWSDAVNGIIWLPRLAAKVRAHDAGTLGTYLLGQSPIDDEFLRAAQLDYAGFIAIVRAAAGDEDVPAAIDAASPGALDRLRLWSVEMPVRRRLFLRVLDFDDGYDRPRGLNALHAVLSPLFVPVVAVARKLRPLRA